MRAKGSTEKKSLHVHDTFVVGTILFCGTIRYTADDSWLCMVVSGVTDNNRKGKGTVKYRHNLSVTNKPGVLDLFLFKAHYSTSFFRGTPFCAVTGK
ncbi:hypothetical protein C0J52_00409 [Blattella germanica]|nr:hypothetical protein C0J52_00409 [Blattella germanica]